MASQDPTDLRPGQHANGPWRLLILDRTDADDPRWVLATVAMAADVRPAILDQHGHYSDWPGVTAWVRDLLGRPRITLVPMFTPLAWTVDERGQPR